MATAFDTVSISSDCFLDPKDDSESDQDLISDSDEELNFEPEEVQNNLLLFARNGRADKVLRLLQHCDDKNVPLDINFKGRNKANLGWTAVHLAAYFGHNDSVRVLIQHGADINTQNDSGDTPLHKAAYTGREETVTLLLSQEANVTIKNAEGQQAKHLARTQSIRRLIEAAENYDTKKVQEEFLRAALENDLETLTLMLQKRKPANISCTDRYGNSALHNATYRGHKEVIVLLVQNGIDTTLRNAKGQTAEDMASDTQIKKLVRLQPIKTQHRQVHRVEGPLLKKTGMLGWRPVWIVLEKGVISIFRNRADASTGVKRKSFRYLNDAQIKAPTDQVHLIQFRFHDGSSWQLSVEMDTSVHINRQMKRLKWVTALTDHISYSKNWSLEGARVSDDEENDDEDLLPLGCIRDTLQTAQAHQQLVERQVTAVTSGIDNFTSTANNSHTPEVELIKINTELHNLVDATRDMMKSMSHAMTILEQQDKVRQVQLDQEREKSRVLQDALRVLAEEHHSLEQSIRSQSRPTSMCDSGDDEFYDCFDASFTQNGTDCDIVSNGTSETGISKWGGRCQLPAPMFSRNDFSVWSILKQCIGKELSKITMPVIFNEPLSFLQRVVEYMEYADILRKATACNDPVKRMEYVTAFAVSATASNWERLGKPFNPLLGETYELNREDLGFKIVCEQVSHHPPVSAFHVHAAEFTLHGAIHPKLKFWGKSIEVTPKGMLTLTLHRHNEVYTWQNVNCCVHNIIVGKIWVEHYGSMELNCLTNKLKAVLLFKPSGWFSKELHKVEGHILDSSKRKIKAFYGKWVEALYSYDMDVWEKYGRGGKADKNDTGTHEHATPSGDDGDDPPPILVKGSSIDLMLEGQEMLWQATPKPHNSSKYYSFTHFAMMLNEMMEANEQVLPPTDCRRRPDMKKMEEGDLDGASSEKNRLEEKQRTARKDRKKRKFEWTPKWFKLDINPQTGKEDWLYKGDYWERDWSRCPQIF